MRAFSLIDTLVAMALLIALMAGVSIVLVAGIRYFHQTRVYTEVQQEATKGMERVVKDLSNTLTAGLTSDNGTWNGAGYSVPPCLVFLSAEPVSPAPTDFQFTPTGELIWQKWLGFHLEGGSLVRSEIPLLDPPVTVAAPAPLPAVGLTELQEASLHREVARDIERLVVTVSNREVRLELVGHAEIDSTHNTRVHLQSSVYLRNK